MPRKNPTYFNVRPRFTCGSGARVDEETALRVASQEKESHEACLTGMFGEADLHRAKAPNALRGIVESITESRGGWHVIDLITGEKLWRGEVQAKKLQAGDRLLEERETVERIYEVSRDSVSFRTEGVRDRPDRLSSTGSKHFNLDPKKVLKIERPYKEE